MRNPFKAFRELKAEVEDLREEMDALQQALTKQNIKVRTRYLDDFYGSPKFATEMLVNHALASLEDRVNWRMGELGKKLGLVFVSPSEVKIPAHWETEGL